MCLPIPVFSEEEMKLCRGKAAEEMLCPDCGNKSGEMISAMGEMAHDGVNHLGMRFSTVVWERWKCKICRKVWVEKYGIASRGQGYKRRG